MGNTISLTMNMNDQVVVQAYERQLKLLDRMERRFEATAKTSKRSSEDMASGMEKCAGAARNWATGIFSLGKGFELVVSEAKKAREEAEKIGREFDQIFNRIAVLNNLKGMETEEAKQGILKNAVDHGFTVAQSGAAADALSSAGVDWRDATGATGGAFLKGLAANGELAADPGKFASSMVGYLESQGMSKDEKGVENIMQRFASMASTTFQLPDIEALSKEGGALKKLSSEEQFAGMATIKDLMGKSGAEAATTLRAVTLSMTAKKDDKKAVEALEAMGLKPDDVDLVGENFATGLSRMNEGLKRVKEKDRDTVLTNFVGTDHMAGLMTMMSNVDKFDDRMEMQGNVGEYEERYRTARKSRLAVENSITAQLEYDMYQKDQQDDLYLKQRRLNMRKEGYSEARIAVNEMGYDAARFLGFSQETAGTFTGNGVTGSGRGYGETRGQLDANGRPDPQMDKQTKAIEVQTVVLQQIRDKMPSPGTQPPPTRQLGRQD